MMSYPRPYMYASTMSKTKCQHQLRECHHSLVDACQELFTFTNSLIATQNPRYTDEIDAQLQRAITFCETYCRLLVIRRREIILHERRQVSKEAQCSSFDFFSWVVNPNYYPTDTQYGSIAPRLFRAASMDILDECFMANVLCAILNYNKAFVSKKLNRDRNVVPHLISAIQHLMPMIRLRHVQDLQKHKPSYRETDIMFMMYIYHRALSLLQSFYEIMQITSTTPMIKARSLWCASCHAFKASCLLKTIVHTWLGDADMVQTCMQMCRLMVGISQASITANEREAFQKFKEDLQTSPYRFITIKGPVYDKRYVVNMVHYELYILHLAQYFLQSKKDIPNSVFLQEQLKTEVSECTKRILVQEISHVPNTNGMYDPIKVEDAMELLRDLKPYPLYIGDLKAPNRWMFTMVFESDKLQGSI